MPQLQVGILLMISTRWQKVDKEGENIEGEDDGNHPLEDCSDVLVALAEGGANEDSGEEDFNDYEEEFHPKGGTKDAVLTKVDAEPLIFSADEDGRDDVSGYEEQQEAVVKPWVLDRIED